MAIKRKTLGSYPYLSVLFSTTMALLVIGIFGVLLIFANKLSTLIKENIELHVYLNQDLTPAEEQKILKRFYFQDYVAQKNNIKQIFYIPKDSAAARFTRETGEEFVQFLGNNPLRDAYRIRINSEFSDKMLLRRIKSEIEQIAGVYEVSYTESLVESINTNINKISLILIGFAMLLIFIIYVLINSSIKLALYSQRFLIRSMQLVGANGWFIQGPFLIRAFLHGVLAGFLASLLLFGVLQYAYSQIPELQILENIEQVLILNGGLIVFGGLIGFVCSFIAVNKYIKMSLNELY
ncbi:MAG: ABC transporter permease [Bacteroidetes bacterium]|nr:MAG: ABC transporter permease [Bacteroidota bacterium]